MKTAIMFATLVLGIVFCGLEASAGRNTDRLLESIRQQQKAAEQQIVSMWMAGNRGKEFETILTDYVAREVRCQAMTGSSDTGSLLAAVSKTKNIELEKPVELGRLIVLEHFKRKGINLNDKKFVKGSYQIGLK